MPILAVVHLNGVGSCGLHKKVILIIVYAEFYKIEENMFHNNNLSIKIDY